MNKTCKGFWVPAGLRYNITYTCDACGFVQTIQNKRSTYPTGWKVGKGYDYCPSCKETIVQ